MTRSSKRALSGVVSQTVRWAGAAVLAGILAMGAMAEDLSSYRSFEFGAELDVVRQQLDGNRHETKVLHHRPALIHELTWRPQSLGPSPSRESVAEVTFTFLENKLYRVEAVYDRYETKGLTHQDLVAAISGMYGKANVPEGPQENAPRVFGDQGELLATWSDKKHRFELWQFGYGPTYKLVGWQLETETVFRAAIAEALRLDTVGMPARDEARAAKVATDAKAADKASRSTNKPNFRP